jgi:hypothetical protein
MKTYCQKCGSGTEYSFDKPKFCASCGSSFSSAHSFIKPTKTVNYNKVTLNQNEEEVSEEKVPDIRNLDFEIEVRPNKGTPIGNLAGTRNEMFSDPNKEQVNFNKQDMLESFRKEAGFYPSRQIINEEEE